MNIASVALVLAAVAVNFGWQPSQEDPQAYEVLMQVEPELVGVMAEGTAVPIESHVPKDVAPIRNIRVVVGKEQLPRTLIATKHAKKSPSERIVRGQEPIEHTANFQADAWGPSSPSRQFNQRGATIGGAPVAASETNPWTVENAQNSLNNAGNSLRDSATSSIEQVNQQFNQTGQDLYNKTKDAASDFGNQLQSTMGFGSQPTTAATSAAPAGQRYAPAPPLSTTPIGTAQAAAPSAGNWTTINPTLAPPRLTPPPLSNGIRVASNPTAGTTNLGPSFPPPPTVDAAGQRSLLSNSSPSSTSNSRESDGQWDSAWGTSASTPAAIGGNDGTGMVPVPPRVRNAAATSSPQMPPTSTNASAPPLDERYRPVSSSPPANNAGADDWANFGRPQNNVFDDPRLPAAAQSQQPAAASQQNPPNQPFVGQPMPTQPNIGTQPTTLPTAATNPPVATPEEVPWKPLLAVSLALAGSIGANFYLGMSYAEARHRYRTLVAKTTHAFEKKAGLAA